MKRLIAGAALLFVTTSSTWASLIASGSLSASGGGLFASESWNAPSTLLSWSVDKTGAIYSYDYSLMVPAKEISHLIIQASNSFTPANILEGTTARWSLDHFSAGSQGTSNPGMPATLYGLKWEVSGLTATWRIVTDRMPIYGNFYAKDGKDKGLSVFVYSGTEGSFSDAVLVPDSVNGGGGTEYPTPLPPASLLLGSGLAGMGAIIGRKSWRTRS